MENLDKANPFFVELFGDRANTLYYEQAINATFISLFWVFSFTLFFVAIKMFRNSNTKDQKISSMVLVVWCIALWTFSSMFIFLEFQKPAPSAGFIVGFVIGTLLLWPSLIANQQATDTNGKSNASVDLKSISADIHNEKVKLKSNFYNAISLALIGTASIAPVSNLFTQPNQNPFNTATVVLVLSGLILAIFFHLLARHALNGLVKERRTTKRVRHSAS